VTPLVTFNADVDVPAAVRAHIDGAGYQIAALLPILRAAPDRVMLTGDASVMAHLLPHGLPPCAAADPIMTIVVHIIAAVGALALTRGDASLACKVLSAKAAAGPRDTVLVVLLASGETGVMTAELELVSASTPTPADPVCNAPGGRA